MCRFIFAIILLALNAETFAMSESVERERVVFKRHAKQKQFLESKKPYVLLRGGRGSGKTFAGALYAQEKLTRYPEVLGLIAANTYDQLYTFTVAKLMTVLEMSGIEYVIGKRPPDHWPKYRVLRDYDRILTVCNGAQARVVSLEKFDTAARGGDIGWAWLDETRDTDPSAIGVVLGSFRGYDLVYPDWVYQLRVTTTPNGFDHIWARFASNRPERFPDSEDIQCHTADNKAAPGFADRLLGVYSKQLAAQEIAGDYINLATGRAYTFSRERNASKVLAFNPDLPLTFSLDFNVAPLCGVIMQVDKKAATIHVLDEIFIPESAQTKEACREFVSRCKAWNPKLVMLAGDASGKNRTTTTTDTNHSIMIRETKDHFKIQDDFDTCNPTQFSRVQAVNAMLEPAIGDARLLIDPKCENLILDLEQVAFQAGTQQLAKDDDPSRTHMSDAAGYVCAKHFPIEDGIERARTFGRGGGFFG